MTWLIVGGSSGLGRALAERFAAAGHPLALISSDRRDTDAVAADLRWRYAVPVRTVALDLAAPDLSFAPVDAALATLPPLSGLLLPAGMNRADDQPGLAPAALDALVRTNFLAIAQLINHCLPRLREAPAGVIIGFGSVAGARGRARNAAYAAAKRALESYFESLRHALADAPVTVQFYVLGYLDTNLAFAERTPLPKAAPERLAAVVYRRRGQDFGRAYYPGFWRPVCWVIERLPWVIYRRLSF